MDCIYCNRDNEKRSELLIEIGELEHSVLFLLKNQNHPGRVVLALKEHRNELFEMKPEERAGYFEDAAKVSKAIHELFAPNKINYGIFGDGVPHIHMHIVPKYKGELQWGQFFQDKDVDEVFLKEEEYSKMIADYKEKLGLK